MTVHPFSRSPRRARRGSALPAVLALTLGVGALTTAFALRLHRESSRMQFQGDRQAALYRAWGQMELVAHMVNTASYDGDGRNEAIRMALARGADPRRGEFIGPDGWPTNVTIEEVVDAGGNPTGMFEVVSTGRVGDAERVVSALVRERQSFADFNYFVGSHSLGVSGGTDAVWPYADAPEGSIHSNDQLIFYFEDRHFRDAVTSVNGFGYTAGARAPDDPDGANTFFHGPTNDASERIDGLLDIDTAAFAARGDSLLALEGEHDYARVWLQGDRVRVDHRTRGHHERLLVTEQVPVYTETIVTEEVPVTEPETRTETRTRTLYEDQDVWVYGPVTYERLVTVDGGGLDQGGEGGSGAVQVVETYTVDEWHWETQRVAVGTEEYDVEVTVWVPTGETRTVERVEEEFSHFETVTEERDVWVSDTLVERHDLAANGTIFVQGDIFLEPSRADHHGQDVHTLDGSLTLVSDDDVLIRDSIVYAAPDADGVLQTAYLGGDDPDAEYVPNPAYTGNSVLGLVARDRIEYQSHMPDASEVNASLLAKQAQVAVDGVRIEWDGRVREDGHGAFLRTSLRRLGGVVSNRRPVSAYVDDRNVVTRGFVRGKSVFDRRQLTTPPRGFPTLGRPRLLATLLREVQ